MDFTELRQSWNILGEIAPVRAIVSSFAEDDIEAFFETGRVEVAATFDTLRELDIVPEGRALDFGCGIGRITQALAMHFRSVIGVDIAASMVARAETYNAARDRVTYLLNEVDDLSVFEDATFDFVFSTIVLQHVGPELAQRYIGEFVRVLAPGGVACFQLPSSLVPSAPPKQPIPPQDNPATDLQHSNQPVATVGSPPTPATRIRGFVGSRFRNLIPPKHQPQPADPEDPLNSLIAMFGVERDKVVECLEASGAEVIAVLPDQYAGPEWTSFRYIARRSNA